MKHYVVVAALLCTTPCAWSASTTSGEALYTRHCVDCHAQMTGGDGSALYSRPDSLVTNRPQLNQRVDYCQRGLGLGWPAEDVGKVTNYLNRNYYHFNQ